MTTQIASTEDAMRAIGNMLIAVADSKMIGTLPDTLQWPVTKQLTALADAVETAVKLAGRQQIVTAPVVPID